MEQDAEERCCPCRPADGQLRMEGEAESFQKKFENFLHNSIIIPRCRCFRGTRVRGSPSIALLQGGCSSASLTISYHLRPPWKVTSINKYPQR